MKKWCLFLSVYLCLCILAACGAAGGGSPAPGGTPSAEPQTGGETARRFIAESMSVPDDCRACRYGALCRNGCRRERDADGKSRWCASVKMLMDARLGRMERLARKMARGM